LQQNSVQTTITSYYKKENIIQTSPASFSAAFGSSSATLSPASRSTTKIKLEAQMLAIFWKVCNTYYHNFPHTLIIKYLFLP
jgi:hypothetical protein